MFDMTALAVCQGTALLLATFLVVTAVCVAGLMVTVFRRCLTCPHCGSVPVPDVGEAD